MDEVTPIDFQAKGNNKPKPRRHAPSQSSLVKSQEHLEKVQLAYEMRAGGKLPSEIAAAVGVAQDDEVYRLLDEQFNRDAAYLTGMQRETVLGLQLMRLEKLLAAAWPSAMMGDPKSIREAGELVMKEARLTQLEQVDPTVNKNLVLVMGEKEDDFIAALKATQTD